MRTAITLVALLAIIAVKLPAQTNPAPAKAAQPKPQSATPAQAGKQPAKTAAAPKSPEHSPQAPAKGPAQPPAKSAVQKAPAKPPSKAAAQKAPEKAPAKAPAKVAGQAPPKAPAKAGKTAKAKPEQPAKEKPAGPTQVARRDPFSPLVHVTQPGGGIPEHLPPGKAGLIVSTLRLDGLVRGPNGMIAVVSNPQQRTYFLREGDKLYDGRVEKISLESVAFHEVGKDAFGKPVERQVIKKLYPSSGEQR